jgi:adenylate cyclase
MSDPNAFVPQDRLRALARGESMADRAVGSALFADISGFVPLTEALCTTLGARRGAEALTRHLDMVYSTLIAEVERHGGSVIDFAGDAMTCWFEGRNAASRAAASAVAMQGAMRATFQSKPEEGGAPALALKVVVTSGPARRFRLGDPSFRYLDVLAGAAVTRAAAGDQLAHRGSVLLDLETVTALQLAPEAVREWRVDPDSGARFAVVTGSIGAVEYDSPETTPSVPLAQLRDWLHKPQLDPEQAFLTEFRPCAALFVRFVGIDYEADEAANQLDAFVRRIQAVAARYDGALIQLTIGDKGSYAYVNFGALRAHEDVARRAVRTALELRNAALTMTYLEPLQMGVTSGTMRAGTYGGPTRRTFGALGDDVNICARLMQIAAPGELLASGQVSKAIAHSFSSEPRPPLPMKGKAEPLLVFAVMGERNQRAVRLQEPNHLLPMVGRTEALRTVAEKLDHAMRGQAQVLNVVAEAGMGKSRLVSESIRIARKKGFICYGGACQSDALHTPYLPWKTVCGALFNIDPEASAKRQIRALEGEIDDLAPDRVQSAPLLGGLLSLDIPDNSFTCTLEPQFRKSALTALIEDCLRAAAKQNPLLIVIEDVHWIDGISFELLEALSKALLDCQVCIVLTQRPVQEALTMTPRMAALPDIAEIELKELTHAEAQDVIRAKLAQLYPMRTGTVPAALVEKLMARAQGNPFFLEELLNYLHDRGLDPRDVARLDNTELPDSLHALVLSLLDQLSERERTTLHVASIIGRRVSVKWLAGFYSDLGDLHAIKPTLDRLCSLGIMLRDDTDPELAYLFKHTVLHEVVYESMSFALRARLHEQLAQYLDAQVADGIVIEAHFLDTLAHHYSRSGKSDKQRVYLAKAGDAALEASAFDTAMEYLTRMLALTQSGDPARAGTALKLAEAHYRTGDYAGARAAIKQAQAAAMTNADRAAALTLLGEMTSDIGDHLGARAILTEAIPLARASADSLALCRALYVLGDVHWRAGEQLEAHAALNESLVLARERGDVTRELFALGRLASVIQDQGDFEGAKAVFSDMHTRAAASGNRERAMNALMNLGQIADKQKDFVRGQACGHQALALAREIGAQQTVALCLIGQASTFIHLGDMSAARGKLREGLSLAWRIGVQPWVVWAVTIFADLAYYDGQTDRALALYGLAQLQPAFIRSFQYDLDTRLAEWGIESGESAAGLARGHLLDWDATIKTLLQM